MAEGLLDGCVEEGVNPWDHAAGGEALILCAPAAGFADLREAVKRAGFLGDTVLGG